MVKVEAITVHSEQVTETTSGNGLRKEKLTRSLVFNLWYVDPADPQTVSKISKGVHTSIWSFVGDLKRKKFENHCTRYFSFPDHKGCNYSTQESRQYMLMHLFMQFSSRTHVQIFNIHLHGPKKPNQNKKRFKAN